MGRRGPKPKPSALDKLDGGASHRKKNAAEPKPPAGDGAVPEILKGNPTAQRIWRALAPGRLRLGLLGEGDELTFAALCNEASIYWRASRALNRSLTQKSGPNGNVKRPEVEIRKGALDGLTRLAAAFGMTPADRKNVIADLDAAAAAQAAEERERAARAADKGKPKAPGKTISLDDLAARRAKRLAAGAGPAAG